MSRRVLVTGLGTFWGGRVAQALEQDPDVEVIVGLDTTEPTVELERTEYVRVDANYSILSRIVRATEVDTIIHTFLVVDPTQMSGRAMHEVNVIGTIDTTTTTPSGQYIASRIAVTTVICRTLSIKKIRPNDMKRRIVLRSFMIRDNN